MKPFSSLELSSFCGQTALILKAGISALEGLTIMTEDAASSEEKEILDALLANMQETGNLYQAMESTGLYPSYIFAHGPDRGRDRYTGCGDGVVEESL